MEYKTLGFQVEDVKAARGGDWTFSGYASTFGNVDLGGDTVRRGAFTKTIKDRFAMPTKPKTKLLWQHTSDEPIGRPITLREDDRGLFAEFKLSRTTRGTDAYELLKDGVLDSLSIGYIAEDQDFDEKTGIRSLNEIDLLEISVVSFPMDEQALITAVKAATRQSLPFSAHAGLVLDEVRLLADRYADMLRLRAEKGKVPGEEARRVVTELKAITAALEVPVVSDTPPPAAERRLDGRATSSSLRLELARRRLVLAGVA